ncbi:hypothetical protein CFC21_103528 [Triticum aestivum]|uniref:Transducin/WD40 repeat-like superfamily protein n=3 Tax=Triticum TaxID=4564 RepID=A0A9R1M8C3_WHEAT|nr:hypothetical protein CFC21_103528 [Triticum aestivum]
MKCHSVAALWSPSPPSHHITAVAATPAALFTGAADGTVLHWPLPPSPPFCPRPSSLLCAHAAAITALCPLPSPASLLVSCTAGVLSLFSASAPLRCLRRRSLPPWAGSPSLVELLPTTTSSSASSNPRVAILCHPHDDGHAHRHVSALVVVDARTLAVLHTAFHGALSVALPRAIALTVCSDDNAVSVVLADAQGRAQMVPVVEVAAVEGDSPRRLSVSSLSSFAPAEAPDGTVEAVALSDDGKVVALVLKTSCLLKCVVEGSVLGEVSLANTSLCKEGETGVKGCLSGGFFLHGGEWGGPHSEEGTVVRSLVLWSSNGGAMVYKVAVGTPPLFGCEAVCEVPGISSEQGEMPVIQYCQMGNCLIRMESRPYKIGGSLFWKPFISIWSMDQLDLSIATNTESPPLSKVLGEGSLQGEEFRSELSNSLPKSDNGVEISSQICSAYINGSGKHGRTVSSSMVLSEDSYAPYAIVYGFHNGDIEVIRFLNLLPAAQFGSGGVYPHISERFFLGHKGAILCLAAHHMHAHSDSRSFRRALISGSLDCTIRVWDLDAGTLLSVMHHHVAAVKQIILPPACTHQPWDDCFVSVGEDGLVALVSLQTMRVERMFPGHSCYPSMVAWDGVKGYIACLCRSLHSCNDVGSILYIWDMKTGARDRIIRGTTSQSVFEHFCRGISKNSVTGGILGGTTSASSLLVPILKGTQSPANRNGMNISSIPTNHHSAADSIALSVSAAHDVKGKTPAPVDRDNSAYSSGKSGSSQITNKRRKYPIKCSCPYPGIASLRFDLTAIMSAQGMSNSNSDRQLRDHLCGDANKETTPPGALNNTSGILEMDSPSRESLEGQLLRFSLCFLHLWDVDCELDKLLVDEMQVCKPEGCHIATGVVGDRGSFTVMFPGKEATLELWKSSAEFCAMRSLSIVSLAQRMITLSRSCTNASRK